MYIGPVATILTILNSVLDEDTSDFRAHLGTLSVALVVALTDGTMRSASRGSSPTAVLSPADVFVVVIFFGIIICAKVSQMRTHLRTSPRASLVHNLSCLTTYLISSYLSL